MRESGSTTLATSIIQVHCTQIQADIETKISLTKIKSDKVSLHLSSSLADYFLLLPAEHLPRVAKGRSLLSVSLSKLICHYGRTYPTSNLLVLAVLGLVVRASFLLIFLKLKPI